MHWLDRIYSDYGLSQAQFSKLTGISESTLTTMRNNGTSLDNTKGANLRKIAKILDLTIDELFDMYGQ